MPDRRAARRFFKNPVAVASTILLLAILTAIVFGPLFFRSDIPRPDLNRSRHPACNIFSARTSMAATCSTVC